MQNSDYVADCHDLQIVTGQGMSVYVYPLLKNGANLTCEYLRRKHKSFRRVPVNGKGKNWHVSGICCDSYIHGKAIMKKETIS